MSLPPSPYAARSTVAALILLALNGSLAAAEPVRVAGESKLWHKVTLELTGPAAGERSDPNPFRDYRLDVTFRHRASGKTLLVPGYFAADGRAAESSADAGDQWRVHFTPPLAGEWTWTVSFRTGRNVAVGVEAGSPWAPLDGMTGALTVSASDKTAPDFRARGTLEYNGTRYLRFSGDGSHFVKAGVGSPETLLGYADFDGTFRDTSTDRRPPAPHGIIPLPALENGLHRYRPHERDWRAGNPSWQRGKGKGLIGGLNYLAGQGVNALYFLTMNVNGDGRNVWPWVEPWVRDRFDVSKLAQWEIVFEHMTRLGIMLHVVTQETENDHLLDNGEAGPERHLYYRELVARFGHHPAITWNLGEENVQTLGQQKASLELLRRLDPYAHHIVIHNDHWHAKNVGETFTPLLGFKPLTGTSLQDFFWNDIHTHVVRFVRASAKAGHPWVVSADELGGANYGTFPDAEDPSHDAPRRFALWGTLMGGGAGVEWYFGWQNNSPHSDLSVEDWRTREEMYRQTRVALDFFRLLPLPEMQPADELATGHGVSMLSAPGKAHAIYLPNGGSTRFDLGTIPALYEVKWFDPRQGGTLRDGPVKRVRGPGLAWTGEPPSNPLQDWAVVVRRIAESAPAMQFPGLSWKEALPQELGVDPAGLNHALNQWRMAVGTTGVDEVVIARRGVVIYKGPQAARSHNVYSVTKSFTSTALGLLISDGKTQLDAPAWQIESGLKRLYPAVRLRHFASMTSGYSAPGNSRWNEPSEDWSATPYRPGKPLFAPGAQYAYWDEAQMMLGRLLTRAGGEDLLAMLRRRIFEPIGINASWDAEGDWNGIPIRNGCTGLKLNALDLARFGQLFLNQGRWQDKQLIPREWIREATRPQVPRTGIPVANTDRKSIDGRGVYGFNWWVNGIKPNGKRYLEYAPAGTFLAEGLHHNILMVIPEWEMVIVRMGEDGRPTPSHDSALDRFLHRLAQAVSPLDTVTGGGR